MTDQANPTQPTAERRGSHRGAIEMAAGIGLMVASAVGLQLVMSQDLPAPHTPENVVIVLPEQESAPSHETPQQILVTAPGVQAETTSTTAPNPHQP